VVGGVAVQLRAKLSTAYPWVKAPTSLKGWHEQWFYICNPTGGPHPRFTGGIPRKADAWKWGCPPGYRSVVDEVARVIGERVSASLSGAGLVRMFLEHRVEPLKQRDHMLYLYRGGDDPTREGPEDLPATEVDR
jgi:hypothetical protein